MQDGSMFPRPSKHLQPGKPPRTGGGPCCRIFLLMALLTVVAAASAPSFGAGRGRFCCMPVRSLEFLAHESFARGRYRAALRYYLYVRRCRGSLSKRGLRETVEALVKLGKPRAARRAAISWARSEAEKNELLESIERLEAAAGGTKRSSSARGGHERRNEGERKEDVGGRSQTTHGADGRKKSAAVESGSAKGASRTTDEQGWLLCQRLKILSSAVDCYNRMHPGSRMKKKLVWKKLFSSGLLEEKRFPPELRGKFRLLKGKVTPAEGAGTADDPLLCELVSLRKALAAGDHPLVRFRTMELMKKHPDDPRLLELRCLALDKGGNREEARRLLRTSVESMLQRTAPLPAGTLYVMCETASRLADKEAVPPLRKLLERTKAGCLQRSVCRSILESLEKGFPYEAWRRLIEAKCSLRNQAEEKRCREGSPKSTKNSSGER